MSDVSNEQVRFASGMNVFLALWQIFSPFILGYAGNAVALWNAVNVGVVVLVLSGFRTLHPGRSAVPSWVNLVLGAWLAFSPFALAITSVSPAKWNDITVGLSMALFALVGLILTRRTSAS